MVNYTSVLKCKTEDKGLLSYILPIEQFDDLFEEDKIDFLSCLNLGAVEANLLNLTDLQKFVVEIPDHLIDGIKNGDFHFGDSHTVDGNYCPNIYDSDNKLVGQATIKDGGIDYSKLSSSLSNIAVMLAIQQINYKLEEIKEVVVDIRKGQTNDRLAKAISAVKSYLDLRVTCKTKQEEENLAKAQYVKINEALNQFFLSDIDEVVKKLKKCPKTDSQLFWWGFNPLHLFTSLNRKYGPVYRELFKNLILYKYLTMFKMALFTKAGGKLSQFKDEQEQYFNDHLTIEFRDQMKNVLKEKDPLDDFKIILNFNQDTILAKSDIMNIEMPKSYYKQIN